jgi:predicted nucleotide-binding protein (sugar kinase/HSP70/actin superfamily)
MEAIDKNIIMIIVLVLVLFAVYDIYNKQYQKKHFVEKNKGVKEDYNVVLALAIQDSLNKQDNGKSSGWCSIL